MAKKSMINRDVKRAKLVERFAAKRNKLRDILQSQTAGDDEKFEAMLALQKLPRDSSPTRMRNRCALSGRPHGFYRKFGLARNQLRQATMRGEVPGLRKASW